MKMNHAWIVDCTQTIDDCAVGTMASLLGIIPLEFSFSFGSLWGVWRKLGLEEDRGENPPGLRGVWPLRTKQKIDIAVVQKREASCENHLHIPACTVDSDGLCFNLAQFTLHYSWHVWGCVRYLSASQSRMESFKCGRLSSCGGIERWSSVQRPPDKPQSLKSTF